MSTVQAQTSQQTTSHSNPDTEAISRLFNKSVFSPDSDCLIYTGYTDDNGYGVMTYRGRSHKAHRLMMTAFTDIPQGMVVMHSCDNPSCIHPSHLRIGTQRENVHDCIQKGRFKPGAGFRGGCANPMAKLNLEMVAEMRLAKKRRDISYKMLAKEYGVSTMTAYRAVKEISWRQSE